MRRILALIALTAMLAFAGQAAAHTTIVAETPTGPFERFTTYTVPTTAYINCAVIGAEYSEGQELTMTIANAADFPWINATETPVTISAMNCEPTTDPSLPGLYNILQADVEFTVGALAPAFIGPSTFQPGAIGETNEGGTFDVEVAYDALFNATTAQVEYAHDPSDGVLTVLLDLDMMANADSTFTFEVTSDVPEGFAAHIQDSLSAVAPYQIGALSAGHQVELHFSAPGADAHAGHDGHDGMDTGNESHMHMDWESVDITVAVQLFADDDPTQISEVREVTFTVLNAGNDTMPHEHAETDDDEGFFDAIGIPGPSIGLVVLGVAGLVLAARRQ